MVGYAQCGMLFLVQRSHVLANVSRVVVFIAGDCPKASREKRRSEGSDPQDVFVLALLAVYLGEY